MSKLNLKRFLQDNELDLSLNNLEDVPVKEILALKKVTVLDLSCNLFSRLPDDFGTLRQLQRLDLSKNRLLTLPSSCGDLVSLHHLDLRGNQLTQLPPSFGHLLQLRWLDLKDNPLNSDLANVAGPCLDEKQCQTCAVHVVTYMQTVEAELEKENEKRLQREKEVQDRLAQQERTKRARQRAEVKEVKRRQFEDTVKQRALKVAQEEEDAALQAAATAARLEESAKGDASHGARVALRCPQGVRLLMLGVALVVLVCGLFFGLLLTCKTPPSAVLLPYCDQWNAVMPTRVMGMRDALLTLVANYFPATPDRQ